MPRLFLPLIRFNNNNFCFVLICFWYKIGLLFCHLVNGKWIKSSYFNGQNDLIQVSANENELDIELLALYYDWFQYDDAILEWNSLMAQSKNLRVEILFAKLIVLFIVQSN